MDSLTTMVSTMNSNHSLIEQMNLEGNCIVVNQTNVEGMSSIRHEKASVKWIDSLERGLSKSRNKCIRELDEGYALIADDDVEYFDGYSEIVVDSFQKNPNIDILIFQVNDRQGKFKQYKDREYHIRYLRSLKVASVQIAFRISSIKNNNLQFNELFGSGSTYKMGEENIFLFECLNKNLKIKYIPKQIAWLKLGDSTWFEGYNDKYLFDRGASFAAMGKFWSHLLILQYAIRKKKLFSKYNLKETIQRMYEGKYDYENTKQ